MHNFSPLKRISESLTYTKNIRKLIYTFKVTPIIFSIVGIVVRRISKQSEVLF